MKIEQLDLHLETLHSHSGKRVFGRPISPPYEPATIKEEVNALIERCNAKSFNINDAQAYARYLTRRFPVLGPVARGVEERIPNLVAVESYLNDLLEEHKRFVHRKRGAARRLSDRLLIRRQCQLCRFDYPPLLELHHLIPLAEGGDNDTLVVLCPTCHRGLEKLTDAALKAMTKADRLALAWWQKNQDESSWWEQIGELVADLVDLYVEHLEYESYAAFVEDLSCRELEIPLFQVGGSARQARLLPF